MKKTDKQQAFPSPDMFIPIGQNNIKTGEKGMSKRFYAACCAMMGLLASATYIKDKEELVNKAYEYADEMLNQEIK